MHTLSVLALSTALLLVGCSSAPPSKTSTTSSSATRTVPSRLSPEQSSDIAIHALGLVGTPYRYGGNTPDSGFDCSGLIGYVYQNRAGQAPPRTVAKLDGWDQPIDRSRLRTGDLVVFGTGASRSHAGIYVGEGRFVHAPSSGGTVRLDHLKSRYWSQQFASFRRP